jgi:C4-dicarboxylate-specific signal transduction histidine kinase
MRSATDNPEFQKDMLMTVEHSVDRMKQLMMQLREGTTPVDAPSGIDLVAIVDRIQRTKANQQPGVELRLEANVAAQGHMDRLERVIGHLVQNAIDATANDGRVWVRLAKLNGLAMIEVGDTGRGMTPSSSGSACSPFQTTKATGMGIGAYESFQYVQELGASKSTVRPTWARRRLLPSAFEAARRRDKRIEE